MEYFIGPMADSEVIAYLRQGILLTIYYFFQIDELWHSTNLGMNPINIIPFIHMLLLDVVETAPYYLAIGPARLVNVFNDSFVHTD